MLKNYTVICQRHFFIYLNKQPDCMEQLISGLTPLSPAGAAEQGEAEGLRGTDATEQPQVRTGLLVADTQKSDSGHLVKITMANPQSKRVRETKRIL